jgi:hypothetical protein
VPNIKEPQEEVGKLHQVAVKNTIVNQGELLGEF